MLQKSAILGIFVYNDRRKKTSFVNLRLKMSALRIEVVSHILSAGHKMNAVSGRYMPTNDKIKGGTPTCVKS